MSRWNKLEAISFKNATDLLPKNLIRGNNVAKIHGIIQRAISDLELTVPEATGSVFKAGDVYDVFRALNEVIKSAEKSIFIIDPYLDDTIFNYYLTSRRPEVLVRLLLSKNADQLKPATGKYISQFGNVVEVKKTSAVHDRVIFVDEYVCWVLGQSLSHAAQAKPTYLVPLSPDVIPAKLEEYNRIWIDAKEI